MSKVGWSAPWRQTGRRRCRRSGPRGPEPGNGEPLAIVLRAGNADSNTAADHIEAAGLAIAQLLRQLRRKVLVRADSGGGTHEFLTWLTAKFRRLHYSVGMTITEPVAEAIGKVPAEAWTPAYDGDGQVREGAWVADITGLLELDGWPAGMRVIIRKERPHPGAQLRFTDIDGHRFTAFATGTKKASSLTWSCATGAGALRGPDPLRQGHRAAEPAAEGVRAEPAVVRDRRAGLRTAGLDPDARPGRQPAAGNPNGCGCACSPSPAAWPAAAAACGSASPSAGPGPPMSPPRPPACKPFHLANQPGQLRRPGGRTPGPVEPRPPGATAGQPGTTAP